MGHWWAELRQQNARQLHLRCRDASLLRVRKLCVGALVNTCLVARAFAAKFLSLILSRVRSLAHSLSLSLCSLSLSRARAFSSPSSSPILARARALSPSLSRALSFASSPSARALVNSPSTTTLTRNPCRRLAGHPDMLRHHKYSVI